MTAKITDPTVVAKLAALIAPAVKRATERRNQAPADAAKKAGDSDAS